MSALSVQLTLPMQSDKTVQAKQIRCLDGLSVDMHKNKSALFSRSEPHRWPPFENEIVRNTVEDLSRSFEISFWSMFYVYLSRWVGPHDVFLFFGGEGDFSGLFLLNAFLVIPVFNL